MRIQASPILNPHTQDVDAVQRHMLQAMTNAGAPLEIELTPWSTVDGSTVPGAVITMRLTTQQLSTLKSAQSAAARLQLLQQMLRPSLPASYTNTDVRQCAAFALGQLSLLAPADVQQNTPVRVSIAHVPNSPRPTTPVSFGATSPQATSIQISVPHETSLDTMRLYSNARGRLGDDQAANMIERTSAGGVSPRELSRLRIIARETARDRRREGFSSEVTNFANATHTLLAQLAQLQTHTNLSAASVPSLLAWAEAYGHSEDAIGSETYTAAWRALRAVSLDPSYPKDFRLALTSSLDSL